MKNNLSNFQMLFNLLNWLLIYSTNIYPVTDNHVADSAKHWDVKTAQPEPVLLSQKGLMDTRKNRIKADDSSNIGMQMIQLKLIGRETCVATQKCLTDGKHELSLWNE